MPPRFSAIRDLLTSARERAVGRSPQTSKRLRLAGRPVELVLLADEGLLSWVAEPFVHLDDESASDPVTLTIRVWAAEAASGDLDMLEPDNEFGELIPSDDGRVLVYRLPGIVSMLDRDRGTLEVWIIDGSRLTSGERARPGQFLLTVWLADHGIEVVHSGVVSHEGKGALFAGMSGAGKSSSTMACVEAGLGFLGDDFIGIERCDGRLVAHSLFATCSLVPENLQRFPGLGDGSWVVKDDKTIVSIARLAPDQMVRIVPVHAVLLPRVTGSHGVDRAAPRDALLRLAPSSIVRRPVPAGRLLRVLRELATEVPAWWIDCGSDSSQIATDVRSVLESRHE